MDDLRTHRVSSADGTTITGGVTGEGSALILLPAGPGDAETSWSAVVPHLQDRFTCHLVDTRGRGRSEDAADHTPERLVEDVIGYADSLDEPVGLVGWGTALWALVAAEQPAPVAAAAAYEPGANEAMDPALGGRFEAVIGAVAQHAAEGRVDDAARALIDGATGVVYTEEEVASGVPGSFWSESASNIPVFVQEMLAETDGRPGPTDPSVLSRVRVPVLLLEGSESLPWFPASVRHVASHVPDARVERIDGAAHFGPIRKPAAVADALAGFFR